MMYTFQTESRSHAEPAAKLSMGVSITTTFGVTSDDKADVRRYFDPPIYWPRGQYIVQYFDPGVIIS